jgi:hypothetical protein
MATEQQIARAALARLGGFTFVQRLQSAAARLEGSPSARPRNHGEWFALLLCGTDRERVNLLAAQAEARQDAGYLHAARLIDTLRERRAQHGR